MGLEWGRVFGTDAKVQLAAIQTSGGSRGGSLGARSPLFLDQNKTSPDKTRRAEKTFFEAGPTPLSQGLDDRAPPYLKVWIRHCKRL